MVFINAFVSSTAKASDFGWVVAKSPSIMNNVSGGEPYGESHTLPVIFLEDGITKNNRVQNISSVLNLDKSILI